jgi:hypothetical protein
MRCNVKDQRQDPAKLPCSALVKRHSPTGKPCRAVRAESGWLQASHGDPEWGHGRACLAAPPTWYSSNGGVSMGHLACHAESAQYVGQ